MLLHRPACFPCRAPHDAMPLLHERLHERLHLLVRYETLLSKNTDHLLGMLHIDPKADREAAMSAWDDEPPPAPTVDAGHSHALASTGPCLSPQQAEKQLALQLGPDATV